jgi:hypothetical protein
VIAASDPEESAERQDCIGNLAGLLVDHEIVDRAQTIASVVEDVGALDLVGGNQGCRFADGVHDNAPWLLSKDETSMRVGKFPTAGATFLWRRPPRTPVFDQVFAASLVSVSFSISSLSISRLTAGLHAAAVTGLPLSGER